MLVDEWRRGGRSFRYRSHEVFYRDDGDGPLLLCLHGFPSASWDWHKLWPALTSRFRVVAPDMLGFGLSAKPRDYDYSLRDQASLHEALLGSLGLDSGHLLAHDYGVSVAQELLARSADSEHSPPDSRRPDVFRPQSVVVAHLHLQRQVHGRDRQRQPVGQGWLPYPSRAA
jgi:pimeloyl-ACP methyl ester carboxylesterase